ncbi:MAG: DUF4352 domain-containing protein [Humibacillus sp.]|nr:DUF4352 domain-containing protein [Humibacillus sp.]MDN5778756.1 DUF4352 domain-containing protein [Humibacillus sp.]
MNRSTRVAATLAATALALTLTGCGGQIEKAPVPAQPSSSVTSATPAPSPTDEENFPSPDASATPDVVDETTEASEATLTEGAFGDEGYFTQDDGEFTVTVDKPTKAKCQYSSLCEKPKTGDRFVTTKVVFKNAGKSAIEVDPSLFVIEFADGTRLDAGDGSALEYQPDNNLEYGHKIRPGATYTSTLTFEAPNGPYSIILLTGSYGGEDLYLWK